MPSVGFCNLGDAYGDWGKKSKTQNDNINDENTGIPGNEKKVSQQLLQENAIAKNNNSPNSMDESLPNLPTFQNAEGCMVRNNRFQDGVSNNQFQMQRNPLNYNGPVNMNQLNQGSSYLSQTMMAPHMNNVNFNNLPNNFNNLQNYGNQGLFNVTHQLPISNQQNTWPPQRWVVDPAGPSGYENYDPYARPYFTPGVHQGPGSPGFYGQMPNSGYQNQGPGYNGQVRENFGNRGYENFNGNYREDFGNVRQPESFSGRVLEYFGAAAGSGPYGPDKGAQLLQLVLFVLVVLFFIQLIEIIINSRSVE
jgi:hypothetical protein